MQARWNGITRRQRIRAIRCSLFNAHEISSLDERQSEMPQWPNALAQPRQPTLQRALHSRGVIQVEAVLDDAKSGVTEGPSQERIAELMEVDPQPHHIHSFASNPQPVT